MIYMAKTYKQIAFDIDTHVAKNVAGKKYTQMYQQIKSFMEKNGFLHQQGSVYVSTCPYSYFEINELCVAFTKKYPYIAKTIRDITVANISKKRMSLNKLFTYTGHADEYAAYYKTHDINDKNNAPQH